MDSQESKTMKIMRYAVFAMLFVAILLVSVLFIRIGQNEKEHSPEVQAMFEKLGLVTDPKAVKAEQDFREDQLNKLRMLKKRFDGLESSVAKIDFLEKDIERIDVSLKGVWDYVKSLHSGSTTNVAIPADSNEPVQQPQPQAQRQCQYAEVEGSWTPAWKWLNQGCSTELESAVADECLSRFDKIVFLGDSQIYHLSRSFIRSMLNMKCNEVRSGGRCGQVEGYLGLTPVDPEHHVRPNPENLEGPRVYGKEHPGCTDCAGCDFGLMNCTTPTHPVYIEYLPVEFARDVEQQSAEAGTTQENVALYLSRASIPSSVVIFNVGLHDSMVLDVRHDGTDTMDAEKFDRTASLYRQNLKWFTGVLHQRLPNSRFIFVTTTPKNMKYFSGNHTNLLVKKMNDDAREVMREFGFKSVDVFPLLDSDVGHALFSDEVHAHSHGGAYYKTLRDFLIRRMCDMEHS